MTALIERLAVVWLILFGTPDFLDPESIDPDRLAAVVLVAGAVLELTMRQRSRGASAEAVALASKLPTQDEPHGDVVLLDALRRAGISPRMVAQAWARERGADAEE